MKNKAKISKIKVVNLRLRAYIGFNEIERTKMQDLVISFSFKYNTLEAVKTDDERFSVNYKTITKSVIKLVEHQHFLLLETLGDKIWQLIKKQPYIRDVEVVVEKPHALRFCDNVLVEISDKDRENEVIIGLGSNINPEENIKEALSLLEEFGDIEDKTELVYTKAQKFENQADFLNGAVLFHTNVYYEDLKAKLKDIEQQLGRVRTENKNGPRTIDLDVTAFNGTIVDEDINEFDFLRDFVKELKPELLGHRT